MTGDALEQERGCCFPHHPLSRSRKAHEVADHELSGHCQVRPSLVNGMSCRWQVSVHMVGVAIIQQHFFGIQVIDLPLSSN